MQLLGVLDVVVITKTVLNFEWAHLHVLSGFIAFLPRCMECSRSIAMGILSVRPSVCLSNACIVTKRKKAMFRFLYHMKEHVS